MRYRIISGIDHHIVTAAFATQFQSKILIVGYIVENVVIHILKNHAPSMISKFPTGKTGTAITFPVTGFEIIVVKIKAVELLPFYRNILHKVAICYSSSGSICRRIDATC